MERQEEMVFNDENCCTLFRLPFEAYPKYKYFRDRLKGFYPRLQQTIDKLPKGLRNDDELQSLNKRIQLLTSSHDLEIAVFGPGNTKLTLQQLVTDHTNYYENREIFRLIDTEGWNDSEAKIKPLTGIYIMGSSDVSKLKGSERPQWLEKCFRQCEPIIFIRDRKNDKKDDILSHLQYVLQREVKTPMRKIVVFQSERDALSTALRMVVEEICVMSFVHIRTYICTVTNVSNLRSNRVITLDELFREFEMPVQHMLKDKDLFALCLTKTESNGDKELDKPYFALCLADRIAILLASKLVSIFKIPGPAIHSFLYASQLREETKDILLNLHDILESRLKEDQAKLKEDTTLQMSAYEKEKDLNGKSSQSQSKVSQGKREQEMTNVDEFVLELDKLKKPIILRIRTLKRAQPTIQTLKRLHFELDGILKETRMHLCADSELSEEWDSICLPTLSSGSRDPYESWKQALHKKLKNVQLKTATVFGKFCVFIGDPKMKVLDEAMRQKIKKVLSNFPYEYEVRIIDEQNCFANGHDGQAEQQNVPGVFKMGMYCRSQGMTNTGSIGLFVKRRNEPSSLFFVTSAHVIPIPESRVEVSSEGGNWVSLGSARVVIPSYPDLIDITAVEVWETMGPLCSLGIEDNQTNGIVNVEVFDNTREILITLEGKEVHKNGASTNVTSGIVSSIYDENHIYVSPRPGEQLLFAEEGDSGSIVWFDTPNGEKCLLSMLMGQGGGVSTKVDDSETFNMTLVNADEGAESGDGQSPGDQLIFTTLLCKGLEELRRNNLDLEV